MNDNLSSEKIGPRRPQAFRALGAEDPPLEISAGSRDFELVEVLKHDSWAATAVYRDAAGARIVCKFNRSSPLPPGLPAGWLGRWLAQREARVFREMAGVAGFPRWTGPVAVEGREWLNAVAHDWIPGRPFQPCLEVNDTFFPKLAAMLTAFHARGLAYVDMSKWGNIIVGDDDEPYLLDYQIHFAAGPGRLSRWVLRQSQAGDTFYLRRHWRRCRPDQVPSAEAEAWSREPPHIWFAERVGPFFRGIRLGILRLSGVRGDPRKHSAGQGGAGEVS